LISVPRGTKDLLPGEVEKWQHLEELVRHLCKLYGYQEIRTPIFEHTELFARGIGETTDIVQKEMYTFEDRGGRSITLRPEGTASVVRAYLEHHLYNQPQPVKLYYIGPMFRYDRPQAGRYRQFHQFGLECLGSHDPAVDAEVICFTWDYFQRLGLKKFTIELNSIGCPICRPRYTKALKAFFEPYQDSLCSFCRERLHRNPLRVLDCKVPQCQELGKNAPVLLENLCEECQKHFSDVQSYLRVLKIPFVINPRLVRGLDYYTHTAFEVVFSELGAQASIAGGGRYNHLVEAYGGPPVPAVGVAVGIERLLLALEKSGVELLPPKEPIIFVATAAGDSRPWLEQEAMLLLMELRNAGFRAEKDYLGRSLKAQMKSAGKIGARYVLILGEEEMAAGEVVIRDMRAGNQFSVPRENVLKTIVEMRDKEEG